MQNLKIFFILFCVIFLFSGCLIIPTPEHSGSVITENTINRFQKEKTTRAEVLLLLGDPVERRLEDRYFVYTWQRVAGYLVVGAYTAGGIAEIPRTHYLCIEFTKDNRIKRLIHLRGISKDNARKRLEQWMVEQ